MTKLRRSNEKGDHRVSGLIGMLPPTEGTVVRALLAGRSPGVDLAHARGKEKAGREEHRDVARIMASERVRRTIASVTGAIRPSDLRSFVMERLVAEAEDAAEGATRMKALENLGKLPGVDLWTPQEDQGDVAATGAELASVLNAVASRLQGEAMDVVDAVEVVEGDAVQAEPDPWD
jgi:hypothetical protein